MMVHPQEVEASSPVQSPTTRVFVGFRVSSKRSMIARMSSYARSASFLVLQMTTRSSAERVSSPSPLPCRSTDHRRDPNGFHGLRLYTQDSASSLPPCGAFLTTRQDSLHVTAWYVARPVSDRYFRRCASTYRFRLTQAS